MTVYVDLLAAPDYLIVDSASFDDNFWAANQQQMQIDAAKYGKELSVRTAAPNFAVMAITSMAQFDNWVKITEDHGPSPVTPPSGGGSNLGTAVAVVGGGLLLSMALMLSRG